MHIFKQILNSKKMNKIQILDCTLRDGGYYTNWDFDPNLVKSYFKSLNSLPIDWIELGYRSKPQKEYFGEYFYCPDYLLKEARSSYNGKIAIMLNEKDVNTKTVKDLIKSSIGYVDMIRLAIDPQNLMRAIDIAIEIKKLGLLVGFNVMYMSKWKNQPDFLENLHNVNGIADFFYMVDSYGGIYPNELVEILTLVKSKLTIPIGFHGHNNLETALINSLTAIENGATMIDATFTGMGRGAGNLKTELLLTALNSKNETEVDFNSLSDVTHSFENLQMQYNWGTNLPYMVSGANSLPQKDVMDWVGKRYYSYNSIIRALHNQKNNIEDNLKYEKFISSKENDEILIIGGGQNTIRHKTAILDFLEKNPKIVIIHASAKNAAIFKGLIHEQYFCLVGIEGNRLEKTLLDFGHFNGNCLLPSFPRKMGTYVPMSVSSKTKELEEIEFSPTLKDSHTALALQASIQLKAKKIFVVGYDGYGNTLLSARDLELFNENEYLFNVFKEKTGISIQSLTPTFYKELFQDSVYSKI
jgi:4-hydroxy 2-oxovalerate aldolase